MTQTTNNVMDDLRAKLGHAEMRQVELNAEILDISYAAHTGDEKAARRLKEIETELGRLDVEVRSLTAALAEAARREKEAAAAEVAAKHRADVETAEGMIPEAMRLAEEFDSATAHAVETARKLERTLADIKRLVGTGPERESVLVNLKRAMTTASMGSPLHSVFLAPADRITVSKMMATWTHVFRVGITRVKGVKPAKEAA